MRDGFPFGLAPFLILVLTGVSGLYLLAGDLLAPKGPEASAIHLWTFARQHWEAYEKARAAFEAAHPGVKADIQLVHGDAVTNRLRAALWADLDVPDAVEVEISRAGSFFRGPVDDVGFVDLTERLSRPDPTDPNGRPLIDRIVRSRLAPYTNRGRIFGLPHDVHPVMLAYRADLFQQFGIDPNKLATWDDFIREGRRIAVRDGRRGSVKAEPTYLINLSLSECHSIETVLFQRDGELTGPDGRPVPAGYFDANGQVIMDNEAAVATLKWYTPLVAGPGRIAADPGMSGPSFARAVLDGYTLSWMCPDWFSWAMEKDLPQLAGKLRLMPLPAFRAGGRRTSTWGGTMIGITRKCPDKELAWKLVLHMYTNAEDLGRRFGDLNILPPFKDAWRQGAFHEPRAYWGNQRIGTEYIRLAEQVPPQYSSPFLQLAKSKMGEVVSACATWYSARGADGGPDEAALDRFVRTRLKQAGDEIRRQMKRNPF
jgi:arabinosaccharide transport system substrate-binding protein